MQVGINHGNGIFDRSHAGGIDMVSGRADDEQLAETSAEQLLGPHAEVGAANEGRERLLPLCERKSPLARQVGRQREIGDESVVAADEPRRRLVGVGCLSDVLTDVAT